MCGVVDSSSKLQGVSIFDNSFFDFEVEDCEEAILKTSLRTTPKVTRLKISGDTSNVRIVVLITVKI